MFWSANINVPRAPTDSSTGDNDHRLARTPPVAVDRAQRVAVELKARVCGGLNGIHGLEVESKRRAAVRVGVVAIGGVMTKESRSHIFADESETASGHSDSVREDRREEKKHHLLC